MSLVEQYETIAEVFARNFCTPPRLPIEEWCHLHVPFENDLSETFNIDITPWFRDPLRSCASHECQEVFVIAGPGLGKTATFMEAFVLWLSVNDPQNLLLVSDNIVLLEQFLDSRLNPLIQRCKPLQPFLPTKFKTQKKLLLLGSMFIMSRAANKSSAQQVSAPVQILDECWLYEKSLINFFRRRGHDRVRRKLICVSQAGFQQTEFHDDTVAGDQYEYLWTCQRCGERQPFCLPIGFNDKEANLKFEGGEGREIEWERVRETVRLECSFCHHPHPDTPESRRTLSAGAIWLKTAEGEEPNRRVYTVPALARYQISYYEFAKEFLRAKRAWKMGDRDPFISYIQQRASKFWKDEYEKEETHLIKSSYSWKDYASASGERIDSEAQRFLTCDVQENTYWIVVRAWRADGTSRLLRFEHIMGGETELREIQLLYRVPDSNVFMDSKYSTPEVYSACSKFNWWAIAGTGNNSFPHPKKDVHGRLAGTEQRLYSPVKHVVVGTVRCKLLEIASERCRDVMARLRDGKSLEWNIPADAPQAYISQIFAEIKKETVEKSGRSVFKWTQIARDNHAFDLETTQVMAAVLFSILKLD